MPGAPAGLGRRLRPGGFGGSVESEQAFAGLSQATRAELVRRIGEPAAAEFEAKVAQHAPILRDETPFVRAPGADELRTIRDAAMALAAAVRTLDASPAVQFFAGGLPRIEAEFSDGEPGSQAAELTRSIRKEIGQEVEADPSAAQPDSQEAREFRLNAFLWTLDNLAGLAETYRKRTPALAGRKRRHDARGGSGTAFCWFLLWLDLCRAGVPSGTGSNSPGMKTLEMVARDIGAPVDPRTLIRKSFEGGTRARPIDDSAWRRATEAKALRTAADPFDHIVNSLASPAAD